ncbi:MAG: LUD domain-containing protein [Candidatus Wallbacteria bacterium]
MSQDSFNIFAANLNDNGGQALKLESAEAAAQKITELVKGEAAVKKIIVHISSCLNDLLKKDIVNKIGMQDSDKILISENLTADCDISITGYDYIIAGSGAVALNSMEHDLKETLVPPVNILIKKAPEIFDNLNDIFNAHGGDFQKISNLTIISGPSKTADIEKKIVHGMHGPKKLFVMIY